MSVGAFCAQADAKPVSAEDVYAAMVQAAKPVEADLAKRQATLPALGYLPANADAYVALAQVGQHIERAMWHWLKWGSTSSVLCQMVCCWINPLSLRPLS